MGAVGAIVSVMMRMASKGGAGFIDYEVGRPSLRRVGSFRPIIGAVFGVVIYFALKSGIIQLSTGTQPVSIYFYATFAFIAGFSERKAMVILGGAERMLGGGGRARRPGAAAEQPAEGRQRQRGGRYHLSVAGETAAPESVVPKHPVLPEEISLAVGGEQTLLLPSSAGAGYVWEASADDETVAEVTTKFEGAGKAPGDRRSARTSC